MVILRVSLAVLALGLVNAGPADFEADLRTGKYKMSSSDCGVSVVTSPATPRKNLGECGCHMQGVLKLTFNKTNRTRAEITFNFDSPKGFSFHIADSRTNDGHAGDYGTQSHDAEIHPINRDLYFQGRDKPGGGSYARVYYHPGFLRRGDVTFTIEDGLVTAQSGNKYVYYLSDKMFMLNGQADATGPVNYDVFLGLNRVITGRSDRFGTGLCGVEINWV